MPSDPRTPALLAALQGEHQRYEAAVTAAAAQMRSWLRAHQGGADTPAAAREELGRFAAGRIDAERFAALFDGERTLASGTARAVRRAIAALDDLLVQGGALFAGDARPGEDVRRVADEMLAEIGRVFGAALVFQTVRLGTYRAEQHDAWLASCPFAAWNRGERALAAPIVIELEGADAHAERLVELLDGRQKIVLVVRGDCPPAPLVRLLSPRVFVQQALAVEDLGSFVAYEGPGIAALVAEGAARFVHDPAGATLAERLTIAHLPDDVPVGVRGGRSAWQLREELEQLRSLDALAAGARRAARADGSPAGARGLTTVASAPIAADGDAAGALAAWLLAQAGLEPAPASGGKPEP